MSAFQKVVKDFINSLPKKLFTNNELSTATENFFIELINNNSDIEIFKDITFCKVRLFLAERDNKVAYPVKFYKSFFDIELPTKCYFDKVEYKNVRLITIE